MGSSRSRSHPRVLAYPPTTEIRLNDGAERAPGADPEGVRGVGGVAEDRGAGLPARGQGGQAEEAAEGGRHGEAGRRARSPGGGARGQGCAERKVKVMSRMGGLMNRTCETNMCAFSGVGKIFGPSPVEVGPDLPFDCADDRDREPAKAIC